MLEDYNGELFFAIESIFFKHGASLLFQLTWNVTLT